MDKIEKIRKKIEELLNDWKYGSSTEAKYRCEVYKELLEYFDALQEEPVGEDLDKAEQRALEAYPIIKGTFIPANNEHEEITQDCNKFVREAYIKGYHQSQKDSKLTKEDIIEIHSLIIATLTNYEEVANKFNNSRVNN